MFLSMESGLSWLAKKGWQKASGIIAGRNRGRSKRERRLQNFHHYCSANNNPLVEMFPAISIRNLSRRKTTLSSVCHNRAHPEILPELRREVRPPSSAHEHSKVIELEARRLHKGHVANLLSNRQQEIKHKHLTSVAGG